MSQGLSADAPAHPLPRGGTDLIPSSDPIPKNYLSVGSNRQSEIGIVESTIGVRQSYGLVSFSIVIYLSERAVRNKMKIRSWIKKMGFWGFMFFLVKGLLWLTVPALVALFAQ